MPLSDSFVLTHKNRLKKNTKKTKEDRRGQAKKAKSSPLRHSWPIGLMLESFCSPCEEGLILPQTAEWNQSSCNMKPHQCSQPEGGHRPATVTLPFPKPYSPSEARLLESFTRPPQSHNLFKRCSTCGF